MALRLSSSAGLLITLCLCFVGGLGAQRANLNNLDIQEPIVRVSPAADTDLFGWATVLHQIEAPLVSDDLNAAAGKTRIIIGAPNGTFPGGLPLNDPGQMAESQTGLVYSCPVQPGECEGIQGNTSLYINSPDNDMSVGDLMAPLDIEGRLFDQAPNAIVENLFIGLPGQFEVKTGQLMGATLFSDGDSFIACAPRWTQTRFTSTDAQPRGACYFSGRGLTNFQFLQPCEFESASSGSTVGVGYCMAGVSVTRVGSLFAVAAPGYNELRGAVYYGENNNAIRRGRGQSQQPDFQGNLVDITDQYQGFQTTTGFISQARSPTQTPDLIATVPRYNGSTYTGRVNVNDTTRPFMAGQQPTFLNITAEGQQMGEFFGYSVAAADLNGDGPRADGSVHEAASIPFVVDDTRDWSTQNRNYYDLPGLPPPFRIRTASDQILAVGTALERGNFFDELVVGAPMYSEIRIGSDERGRVYVFNNTGGNLSPDSVILDGQVARGRFGTSVTNLGDIDDDGYEDIAIGAPYVDMGPNQGSVYIYYGRADILEFGQQTPFEIRAEQVVSNVQGLDELRTFGWSLSSGVDVDNNQYRDLSIGAYESKTVVLLRTLPVASVNVTFDGIPQVNFNVPSCMLGPCFNVTIRATYTGRGLNGALNIDYTLSENTTASNGTVLQRRLVFDTQNSNEVTRTLEFTDVGLEVVDTVTVYVRTDVADTVTPYQLQVEVQELTRPMRTNFDGNQTLTDFSEFPRLRQIGAPRTTEVFSRNCDQYAVCGDCFGDYRCIWCNDTGEELCLHRDSDSTCSQILDPSGSIINIQEATSGNPVSIQNVQLNLRVGVPQTFTVQVTPLRNLPLDLYILMDLSNSMGDELESVKVIVGQIIERIRSVTENVHIGFGSFSDKVTRPFTRDTCGSDRTNCPLYAFRHQIDLTNDTQLVTAAIQAVTTTTNVDNPENGLEALAQVVSCEDIIGWRSRNATGSERGLTRVVLFLTDDQFHYSGEGRLAGILRPYDGQCYLERDAGAQPPTEYLRWNEFDYPSVGQIISLLTQFEVVTVFSIAQDMLPTYQNLRDLVNFRYRASAATLTSNSADILNLIDTEYLAILQTIGLQPAVTDDLNYFIQAACPPGAVARSDGSCDNVPLEAPVTFTVSVTLNSCDDFRNENTPKIARVNVPGLGGFDITYTGVCSCDIVPPTPTDPPTRPTPTDPTTRPTPTDPTTRPTPTVTPVCNDGDLRLVGGDTELEGRVEVCFNNTWGTVCDDFWDVRAARVVCRQLELPTSRAEARFGTTYGQGEGPIFLDNVVCRGTELRLANCSNNGVGVHNCFHNQDAGVVCRVQVEVGISTQTVAIDLGRPRFTLSEGDQFQLCVEILEGEVQQESVVVRIETYNGTAVSGSDFREISTNVTFLAGSSAGDQACINVSTYSDGVLELSEEAFTVAVLLSPLPQFHVVFIPFDRQFAPVTIVDTNIVGVGFEQSSYTVSETSPVVDVCVRLSGASFSTTTMTRPVILRVASRGETATAGQDYLEITPRILSFPPSTIGMLNTSKCFTIDILNDEENEGSQPESFFLSLSVFDVAVVVSQESATVYILDDDEEPTTEPTTEPPIGPLVVSFSGNTPRVMQNTVTVQVFTNKPASATCRLGRAATMPCPPGSTTVFENVPPRPDAYSLRVTATTDAEEAVVFWKVYVPARPTICSVNLINFGLVVNDTHTSAEFQGVGPTTGFSCRLDSGRFDICVSPQSFPRLSPGEHRLRILPEGCLEVQGQTFRFTV